MEIVVHKNDVWGQEVLLGVSWDLLWLIVVASFVVIIVHLLVMAVRTRPERATAEGTRMNRHAKSDRIFHWVMAVSTLVLLFTGILPIIGVKFGWLTIHWISGIVLTASVLFHIVRSLFWQDPLSMWVAPSDLREPFDSAQKPGKYSLAQKGMHLAMTLVVLVVIGSGLVMLSLIDTPLWAPVAWLSESALGWVFVLHGASTLALIALTALHIYFGVRPEKLFYTRSMIKGWISEPELEAHHDPARWVPDKTA
ncbi:MAG: cytochrome b/b6 domain-containing protein [Gammaproteobacteria bacterium]|nr:cytochrome b/b6 domain-containing protein [Gammaproteobacteria bacterium]